MSRAAAQYPWVFAFGGRELEGETLIQYIVQAIDVTLLPVQHSGELNYH